MKFEIEVEEKVTRTNKYVFEVGSVEEGEKILSLCDFEINAANHPDDVIESIINAIHNVIPDPDNDDPLEIHYGAEDVEYEVQ